MRRLQLLFIPILFLALTISCSEDTANAPQTVTVSGVVQKAAGGGALSGADIIASRHVNGEELGRTTSDSTGAFVLRDLPYVVMDLRIEAQGYAPISFESMNPETSSDELHNMSVVLAPVDTCCSGVLTLIVRDQNNAPIPGVKVLVRMGSTVLEDPRTDENGRIVVDGLCMGNYNYRLSKEGYKVVEAEFTINEYCEPVTREVTMEPESQTCCDGVLTVKVRDPQNQPVAGAVVKIWKNGSVIRTKTTDAAGTAVFGELCGGEYGVDVMKEGWTSREFSFAINENCDPVTKEVTVEQVGCCSGVLTLIVRDAQNNPIEGAKVQVRKGSQELEAPITNASGRIVVDGLCKGEYNYRISKEGYKVVEGVFAINENCDPVTREVTLESNTPCCSGVLTVKVRDPQNQPVADAVVKVWKNGSVIRNKTTDATGTAVFEELCGGEYGVDVIKEGWTNREFSFAINESCDPVTKEVTVEQTSCCSGVLTIVVRDAQNNPIVGAKVQVRKGSQELEAPTTNANGRIVVDGLCKGEYNYRISKEGFKVVEGVFAINENCDPVTREVTLESNSVCCSGVLTVTVVDSATAAPINDAAVKLWKNGVLVETLVTNSSGTVTFDHLCAGPYGVGVQKNGYRGREFSFTINENCDPYSKTIELVP